ncbi:DUF6343 family protein [Streptomyces sp. ok210]|uniref:DUF6343 family protein n=2 Tax=Streptomyces TaxID=1883 RepID=UPI00352332BD
MGDSHPGRMSRSRGPSADRHDGNVTLVQALALRHLHSWTQSGRGGQSRSAGRVCKRVGAAQLGPCGGRETVGRNVAQRPEDPAGYRTCPGPVVSSSEVSSMSQMPPHEPRDERQSRSPKRHRRAGTEPLTARSDLGLRRILSTAALVLFALATAGFAWWAASSSRDSSPSATVLSVLAAVCGVLLLVAVIDLAVIRRRRSGQRR